MRTNQLKTTLGDTVKLIFKTKEEYNTWMRYVKDVCISCEKVDPIFKVIPQDLLENTTENVDTGEYIVLLLPEVTSRFVIAFMELCVVQKRHAERDAALVEDAKACLVTANKMKKMLEKQQFTIRAMGNDIDEIEKKIKH